MKTLKQYLESSGAGEELGHILLDLTVVVKKIAASMDSVSDGKAGSENVFGEEQMALDLVSNDIATDEMRRNKHVGVVASEEMDEEEVVGDGPFGVCYDPLDGSSLIDVNLSVGSIFGVYKCESFIGVKGNEQLAALIAVYGPKTTIFVTVGEGTHEFMLRSDGEFVMSREGLKVAEEGKMFAPGNLRACSKRKDYLELLDYWAENEYKLRYSGGMVPDVGQIMVKGKGVFTYPGYEDQPDGKGRVLYECAPMAFLMEQCGGAASYGAGRILDVEIQKLDQRSPIFIGSKKEVERVVKKLG